MATAPSRASLIGSVLSRRWRLVQKLGDGGIGEIYAAEPAQGGPRMAVKVLRPEFLADPVVLARFAEEGRTCMRLIHPNVVRVTESANAEDGSPYLVMELLEGVPLSAYTQNGGRVPVAQAIAILHGILAGLSAAHTQGIVHRDLKPENVFLVRVSGGTFMVKVLDFGIANVMDAAGGMGTRTRSGTLLGTPAYMSPEQTKNPVDVDQRADLWSAGVILYEMLTGRSAFPAPTDYARLLAVLSAEPEPIDSVDSALAELAPCVGRALQKNRDRRFVSAHEMARALTAAVPNKSARIDGADAVMSPSGVGPLTHMPQLPSMFAHSVAARTAPGPMATLPPETAPIGRERPGGTLPSAMESDAPVEPLPQVVVADIAGTLPSKALPLLVRRAMRDARVARGVVAALIALSLAAGFLLGWASAHLL